MVSQTSTVFSRYTPPAVTVAVGSFDPRTQIDEVGVTCNIMPSIGMCYEPSDPIWTIATAVRVKKIHYEMRARTVKRVWTSDSNTSKDQRGADLIVGCTRFTGPINDLYNNSSSAVNGFLAPNGGKNNQPYGSQVKCYSAVVAFDAMQAGSKAFTYRRDVGFTAMKPIRFSFAPTLPYLKMVQSPYVTANAMRAGNPVTNGGDMNERMVKYRKAPWLPLYLANAGTTPNTAITSQQTQASSGSLFDNIIKLPHLGIYSGIVPGSMDRPEAEDKATAFPVIEFRIGMDLEFKVGVNRYTKTNWVAGNPADTGALVNFPYADWGNYPTIINPKGVL